MDPAMRVQAFRGPPIDPTLTRAPRALVMLTLLLLALEFLFGNIWSIWPTTAPTNVSQLFGSSAASYGYLSAHAFVAIALVLSSVALIVFIRRLHRTPLLVSSVVAFLLTGLAAVSGSELLATQNNDYALLMAVGFLAAWTLDLMIALRLRMISRMAYFRAMHPEAPPSA